MGKRRGKRKRGSEDGDNAQNFYKILMHVYKKSFSGSFFDDLPPESRQA